MTAPQIPKALQFAPPPQGNPQTWDYAVAEGLKFPERFVQKAKEVAQMRVQNGQLQEKLGYFVRNLIAVVDNCEEALAAAGVAKPSAASPSEPDAVGDGSSDAQSPPTSPDQLSDPQQLALASLASVHRSVTSLLENLGVVQVELLGKNYENVTYEGTAIPDPFEVLEVRQEGATRKLPVVEVVRPLWVQHAGGKVKIVRSGKVCC